MDNSFEGSEEHPARERGIATIRVLGLLAVFLIFAMATAESSGATGFRADKLSAGVGHSCAIRDGGAWCWGSNSQGELGNGTTDDSAVPVPVTGFSSGVTDIAAGSGHTCAIKDGGAWCWGTNQVGELGNGSFGGTQISNPLPIPVTGLDTGVTAISAGRGYSCASRFRVGASYESYCWGSNLNWRVSGEDGAVPWEIPLPTWTGVAMPFLTVSAGYGEHTCTIVEAGVVPWQSTQARCWGNNEYGQSGRRLNLDPGSGQPFEYFPSPMKKAIVINNDIPGTKQLTAISAGQDHTCLVNLGGVMCQGKNHHGQLGDGTTTHTTAKSETPDERHIGWVSGLGPGSDVTSILTGFAHSCALSTTKGMRCWGYNRDGQLGDGTWGVGNQSTVPVQATAFEAHGEVTAISGLSMRTCAIVGGGIWCNGFMDDPGPHPVPEAPLVTISAPSDGALLTTPSVEVTFGVTGTPTPACKVNGADEAGPTATVPLTLGVNTIAVTCTSSSGGDTATVQVHRYSQLPVAIIQPSAASTTSSAINVAYSVNGQSTIPDDSSCKVNGNASTAPTLNEVQLSPGANTITVICSNPATTQTATATIGRYSPLSVAITDPADGAGTIDGQVNVAYTVNGESSIPDDSSCKVNGGSSSDSAINEVNLALGANMVTVSCSNPAGSESVGITVYRNQAPVISDIMPRGQPYATAEPETDVSFTVAGYPAPSCTVNGRPSGGRTTETLEPGMNYFVIRCENVFGGATHSATETVPVLRMAAPVVTIGSPENGSVVTAPQVALSFTASGYEQPACTVNGAAATSPADVNLTLGINTVTVRCQNSMGADLKSVSVIRHQVPAVSVATPADGFQTTDSRVDVEFSVSGFPVPDCTVDGEPSSGEATVDLAPGENLIRVLCSNEAGEDSVELTVIRHVVPQVSLVSPADGFQTTDSRVDVEFSVSGFPVPDCTVDGEPSSGEATVDLVPGENLIRVLCSNEAGEDSVEVTVTRNQAPEVNIEFPLDGHQTTRPEMTVAFSATGFPVPDCEVNGTPASSPASVNLAAGGNPVTVRCQSTSGTDQKSVTVIRHVVPQVSLVSPADGFQTTDSRVDVEFSVSGFPVPDCTVDGKPSSGEATVDLVPGENLIRVLCSNEAGEDSVEVTVTRNQAPEVSIDNPGDGFRTTASNVTVEYTVRGFPTPVCTVNGEPHTSPASLDLAIGKNAITVNCSNNFSGETHSGSGSIEVSRHEMPRVTILSPPDRFPTTDSRVDVEFSVSGFPVPDCTVDGKPSSGQATVDLVPGENLIRVLCSNEAGEDSVEVTVVRHRGPEPSLEKPRITHAPETAGIGGVIRFRLDCDTRCRVAPTLSVGSRKRRLQRLWRPAGTHRESYRLRPKTIATLRVRKRNHPRLRIVLKLRPKSHIGFGRAVRIRIGSPYSPDRSPTGSDASHMLVGGQW